MRNLLLNALAVAAFILGAVGLVMLTTGCNGKAASKLVSDEIIRHPTTGRELYHRHVSNGVTQELAPNASGPTTMRVTLDGIDTLTAGQAEKPLAAYGVESRTRLLYGTGVALVLAAAAAGYFKQKMLAACLAAAAGVLFAVGMLAASPTVAAIAGLLVFAGALWAAARAITHRGENLSGVSSAIKLGTEGKPLEAIAALRETPIGRRAAT